jgi:hypothetical protein
MFRENLLQIITQKYKNKRLAAKETETNEDFIYRIFKRDEDELIVFLRKIILQKNLSPEEVYQLITNTEPNTNREQLNDLPKHYICQTKSLIKALKDQVDDLKQQRDFLQTALMEHIKNNEQQPQSSKPPTHTRGLGQHVAHKGIGKNSGSVTTAPP